MREARGWAAVALGVLQVGFVGWSLYGAIVPVETYTFRLVHLAFIFVLGFLCYAASKRPRPLLRWLDVLLAAVGLVCVAYALLDLDQFIRRSTVPEPADMFFGLMAIVLLLELSRRTVGTAFLLVVLLFLAYTYFGPYFPAAISHKGYDLSRIVGHMYMTLEGILGVPLSVSASFVILFVVYGTFMDAAGAGKFWLDLSMAVMGRRSSSAGRGAVITSALLGGPQASGVATTMSVAPIMWPILKQAGYSPDMAAGLVSAGGIGAVISPPLMGAAAFLIMQFLNVTFWNVVLMVLVPTLLYYLGIFFTVELEARKHRFAPPDSPPITAAAVLRRRGYHLISLVVLVALLALGKSPESAAIWAIVAVVLTSFWSKDRSEWLTPRKIVAAVLESANNMLPVAVLLAAAGLIVGVFSLTGLGLKISGLIMSLSGGSRVAAVLLAFVASLLIGLSLPITATYIMTVVMVAPALVAVGVPAHVAHLLAFYFAVLSEVSPPVGLSPSAAAAVTGANPFAAMVQAWKYSIPAFLVPFFFSVTPVGANLVLVGATWTGFLQAAVTSVCSLLLLAVATTGYLRTELHLVERVVLAAVALVMVLFPVGPSVPGTVPLVVAAVVLLRGTIASRRAVQAQGDDRAAARP